MDRKLFLAAAAGIGAAVAATGTTRAATPVPVMAATPIPGYSPSPGLSPRPHAYRRGYGSDHNLSHLYRRLERMIESLQHDTHDYCGHRVQAIGYLEQARDQLQAALSCDAQH